MRSTSSFARLEWDVNVPRGPEARSPAPHSPNDHSRQSKLTKSEPGVEEQSGHRYGQKPAGRAGNNPARRIERELPGERGSGYRAIGMLRVVEDVFRTAGPQLFGLVRFDNRCVVG